MNWFFHKVQISTLTKHRDSPIFLEILSTFQHNPAQKLTKHDSSRKYSGYYYFLYMTPFGF